MSTATPFPWPGETAETELRHVIENAPMGIAQCSQHGVITAMNPALVRMLKPASQTPPPLQIGDLLPGADRADGERLFREMLQRERTSFQTETKLVTESGVAWVRWTGWLVSGNPDYALLIAEDTSEDRRNGQRLLQAQKLEALGRLATGVAHDFNNLLTGVLLYCDLLLAGLEPGDRLHQYAEEVRAAAVQASGLVQQLLTVARPQSVDPRPLSLNDIAEETRNLLTRLIGENIELLLRLDPALGRVKMDPGQVQQVLLNLVLNARDALPSGGKIAVETRNCNVQILTDGSSAENDATNAPCALLVVSDNGGGMDAKTRDRVFEAFFTTKGAGKGTGVGLNTVQDIITSSGGLVSVDSNPGCGTRVSLLLPLIQDPAAPESGAKKNGNHD